MTLGLILSPVSGSMTRSYADEVSREEIETKEYDKIDLIQAYLKSYEQVKLSELYRFASKEKQDNLDKVMEDAKEYAIQNEVTLKDLDNHIEKIKEANSDLSIDAKFNLRSLKENIIVSGQLLHYNENKSESEEYKSLTEKIEESKNILKDENLSKATGEDLIKINKELLSLFQNAKEAFGDDNEYRQPRESDFERLDKEINNREEVTVKKSKYSDLLDDVKILKDKHEAFIKNFKYQHGSSAQRKAYDDAFEIMNSMSDLEESQENYDKLSLAAKNVVQARFNISNENLRLKTIKVYPYYDNNVEIIEILRNLNKIRRNKDNILSKLKDENLKKTFKKAIFEAETLEENFANGYISEYKVYKDLNDSLNNMVKDIDLSEPYKRPSIPVKPEEKGVESKKEALKTSLVKAYDFRKQAAFKSAKEAQQKKLNDVVAKAEDLIKKSDEKPGSVADKELEDAKKAVDNALADFNKFADKDSAKKALNALLNETQGINIDQFYGKDQKEARDAYTKAREAAAKAVKNIDKTSLEDLNNIHKDFKENIDKLAGFLNKRLKDLVDDDDSFRKTDEYKEADKDTNREESIVNYIGLLTEAQEELKKAVPDANRLNILYNKLANARSEITKKISPEKRKLSDAVLDSYVFLKSKEYQKALTGSDKYLKYAAEKYRADLERAKKLLESSEINKDEAKEVLESLNKAKDFIESKIKEKEYLIYEYTKKLNEIKNHKDYKNLNQAIRKRLEDALVLAGKGGDKDEIFRALDEVMGDASIKEFIKKMEAEKNPNITRDKLLTDLTNLINEDKKLKEGGFKYQKAQKALRDAYDVALKEATDFIRDNKNPSEDEVRAVYQKLLNAKNALDGDKFDELIHALAARFKKEQLKIANPADRKAIADKINALSGENMTMDDALRVEKELDALINPQVATTTTLTPQGGVVTNTRPVSTVTNPGSTVKTGINGIAKVAAVLVVAAIILIFTRKKGDKNETNK